MLKKTLSILIMIFIAGSILHAKDKVTFQLADSDATDDFWMAESYEKGLEKIPADCEIFMKAASTDADSNRSYIVVKKEVLMDRRYIENVQIEKDFFGIKPQVTFVLTDEGRELFAKITKENLNKELCIIACGKILICAVIRMPITEGSVAIVVDDLEQAEAIRDALAEDDETADIFLSI